MKRLTTSDRSAIIKLASALPTGSEERRVLLKGLGTQKSSYAIDVGEIELAFTPMGEGGVRIDMGEDGRGGHTLLTQEQFNVLERELLAALQFVRSAH